jgi:hypothetical protein
VLFAIKVTGVQQVARAAGQEPDVLREAARDSVQSTLEYLKAEAARRTALRYNLSQDKLGSFVLVRRASVSADGVSGSVTLQLKAVPLTEFGAEVEMREFSLTSRTGRTFTRRLPTVQVAIYRGRLARALPGGFPLRQRNTGALLDGEGVRKRVGSGRGHRSDGTYGAKLTGFRFYTFPKRITNQLVPELNADGQRKLSVDFKVAYRKQRRGLSVLANNG